MIRKIIKLYPVASNLRLDTTLLLLSILLSFSNLFALNPQKIPDEYLIRNWNTASGLPHNRITALLQTQEGYIWLGTPSGLVRFDGVTCTTFTRWNTPDLTNDHILALYEDANNALWIGTDGGGLFSLTDGKWQRYSDAEGLSNTHVRAITSDWYGNLWIGTEYGLNRLFENELHIYTTAHGLYDNIITSLTIDIQGNLWIGTLRGGMAKFKDGAFQIYDYGEGLTNVAVNSIYADEYGAIWAGTLEGLFYLPRGEELFRYVSGTGYTPITSIIGDQHGTIWIGTMADGLKRFTKGTLEGYSNNTHITDIFITSLIQDREQNIWIGTDSGGLLQMKDPLISTLTPKHGLPDRNICTVLQDREGTIWIGTRSNGLCKMRDNKILTVFTTKSGLSSNRIRALHEDVSGRLWIGTEDAGINLLQNSIVTRPASLQNISFFKITCFHSDKSGAMWIGTNNGLYKYYNESVSLFAGNSNLSDPYIRVLLEAKNRALYIGTRSGLFVFSENLLKKLENDNRITESDITALYEDREGSIWIGTHGDGLLRLSENSLVCCTTEHGLHDNFIFSITEDESNLWLSSYNGIFKVSLADLNAFCDGSAGSIFSTFYDEADGMASRQCSSTGQPGVYKTTVGTLLYPSTLGLAVLDPDSLPVRQTPPSVLIEDLRVDGISRIDEDNLTITARFSSITIHITAFDYSNPEKLHFKYKLEGHDKNLTHLYPRQNRLAAYGRLKPGNYKFVVYAANNDGVWSTSPVSISFTVNKNFYSSTSFYALILVSIFLLTGIAIVLPRRRRAIKKSEKYKTSTLDPKKADELTPKLTQLMDEEKIYLNPDLTLSELAKSLKIHSNHLSRIINERFGFSFNDFINSYRIKEAQHLLSDPQNRRKTITEIMYDCGFYSKSVFNTAFKKFTGFTPSEYRKKYN